MSTADRTPFAFSAEENEVFTDGDCWELARQVNILTGWAIVTASDSHDWYHAGNRLPDGSIVDIMGVWSQKQWLAHWDEMQARFVTYDENGMHAQIWSAKDFNQEIVDEDIEFAYTLAEKANEYAAQIAALVSL